MPKSLQKYFIAISPEGNVQEQALQLKELVREQYNAKHALKSPAHITLKMPFVWNEHKEEKLLGLLQAFFEDKNAFDLEVKGIGRFGRRIIYARVHHDPELTELQAELKAYTRLHLKLHQEMSDQAFHAHMTLVYRDLKPRFFDECLALLKEKGIYGQVRVRDIALLKKVENRWKIWHRFGLEET